MQALSEREHAHLASIPLTKRDSECQPSRVLIRTLGSPRKRFIAYDDPSALFCVYRDYACDEDGYPFVWPLISRLIRLYAFKMCEDCGLAYDHIFSTAI